MKRIRFGNTLAALATFGAALGLGACNTYYIPPPPVSIYLQTPVTSVVITSADQFGNIVPTQLQLQATVSNAPTQNVIYSVGQEGNFITGGNNVLGYVSSTGLYICPAVVPTPNTVTIQAKSVADPTQVSTVSVTLLNQSANPTELAPSVVTVGQNVTFDVRGYYFAPSATVNLSGAQIGSVDIIGPNEIKVPAHITAPGLLSLNVLNPDASGNTNAVAIRSEPASPAASSSIAVLVGQVGRTSSGTPVTATKGYIPEAGSLAVVNLDNNKQIGTVVMPNGYQPTIAAAHPAQGEVIAASSQSNILQVINANNDQVENSLTVPVSGSVTVDGAKCQICAMVVDSTRDEAVLDTASGYFTLNLADGTTSTPLVAPAASGFAYDPSTQRIYAPYANSGGSGVNVIDLGAGTVQAISPGGGVLFGAGLDTAALDPGTEILDVGDPTTSSFAALNLNSAKTLGADLDVPASTFSITGACLGAWNGEDLSFTAHLGWFTNLGGCVAVATLPTGAGTGAPGAPVNLHWAQIPVGPDGLPWSNMPLGSPRATAVYLGSDGRTYGLAVRSDSTELLKMDLDYLQNANAVAGSADVNQVDAQNVTVNGQTVSAMVYIPLH